MRRSSPLAFLVLSVCISVAFAGMTPCVQTTSVQQVLMMQAADASPLRADPTAAVIDLRNPPYYAACDGVTDDTAALTSAIAALQAGTGGEIVIPGPLKVTRTIAFAGSIAHLPNYSPNYYGSITLRGAGPNAGIIAATGFPDPNVIQLGSGRTDLNYKLVLRDLIVDGGAQQLCVIHGGTTPDNHTVDFDHVEVKGFTGAGGVGIDTGRITDSRINHCRIQGQGYGTGIIARRSTVQLVDCKIMYCHVCLSVASQPEAGVQMIGGELVLSDYLLGFDGRFSGNHNHNYLNGVWLGELRPGMFQIHATGSPSVDSLSFINCAFGCEDTTRPLLDFSAFSNCTVNLIGNVVWNSSARTDVLGSATTRLVLLGNTNMTVNSASSRAALQSGEDVYAEPRTPGATTFGAGGRIGTRRDSDGWLVSGLEGRSDGGGGFRGRLGFWVNDGSNPTSISEYGWVTTDGFDTPGGYYINGLDALHREVIHNYGGTNTTWAMTAGEATATLFTVTNVGGDAAAVFPAAVAGKQFVVDNQSGHTITVLVTGQRGATSTSGKKSLWIMTATDCDKIVEQ